MRGITRRVAVGRRFRRSLTRALIVASAAALVLSSGAFASSVDESIVDAVAPTGSVTLSPGASGAITINLVVTGRQAEQASFQVNRDWTLSGGSFTGANPATFVVPARAATDPATKFSTSGTVTVATGQAAGSFELRAGAINIVTSGQAKLAVGASSSYTVVVPALPSDTTPPAITPNVSGILGANGWYISDVHVSWTVLDPESAISSTEGCGPTDITADTAGTTLTCRATSTGGTAEQSVAIKRDTQAPVITPAVSGTVRDNGWYITDVFVSWDVEDALSGVAETSAGCAPEVVTEDTAGKTITCSATDAAGWTATEHVVVKRDAASPEITPHLAGTLGTNDWYTSDVTVSWTATAVSGIAAMTGCDSTTITEDTAGTPLTCRVTSGAGNTSEMTITVKRDATPPVITPHLSGISGLAGWYVSDVDVTWTVGALSGIATSSGCELTTIAADTTGTDVVCAATSGSGLNSSQTVTVKRDATAPVIGDAGFETGTAGSNGWYVSAVSNAFTAEDPTSGLALPCTASFSKSSGSAEGASVTIGSGSCSDVAGNKNIGIESGAYKIDLSDPYGVAFVGGPAAGASYYFGAVPAAPTCTATDDVSGLASCVVTGFETSVGTHTMTATATDNAGRSAASTRTYTVLAWTLIGFYRPVDMWPVYNTVKNGSTVPLKFNVWAGPTELTSTTAIKSIQVFAVAAPGASAITDPIEVTATGGTVLRWDANGDQFIFNWQTPKTPGRCYEVVVTTQDGSTLAAYFILR